MTPDERCIVNAAARVLQELANQMANEAKNCRDKGLFQTAMGLDRANSIIMERKWENAEAVLKEME